MKEILLINPGRPKKKRTTKKSTTRRKPAAKKKITKAAKPVSKKKAGTMAKRKKKRTYKKNPSPRSVATRALGGLNLPKASLEATKAAGGMLIAQFFAKKFAKGGGANNENWNVKNYAFAALGALAAGLAGNMIKKGSGQEMFKGGLALVMYKIVTNEIAPQNKWLESQLGQFDEMNPAYQAASYLPAGDLDVEEDFEYLLGQGDVYAPAADPNYPDMGEDYNQFDLGEPVVSVSSLGEVLTEVSDLGADPYSKSFYN